MKLYKFRPLVTEENLNRIKSIFNDGFHCCNFLDFKAEITKVHFGAPYKRLINYSEIKKKHTKLREYLSNVEKLKTFLSTRGVSCDYFHLSSHA